MAGPDGAIVLQFEMDYQHNFQQQVARLMRYVRVKTGVTGSMASFATLGEAGGEDITGSRHAATNWIDSPSYRRWAPKEDKIVPQMLDEEDNLEILQDLEMGYAQNGAMRMGRFMDKTIIDAVTATAYSGATGTTANTFNTAAPTTTDLAGRQIAVGGTGLTPEKMREARKWLLKANAGTDNIGMTMGQYVWVTNAEGHDQLLGRTEATSTDYIGVNITPSGQEMQERMPLVGGYIPRYMGFHLVLSEQLNMSSTNFVNLAWHRDAVGLAIWGGRRVWVGDLPEHNLSRGIIVKEHFGAVRIQDPGVLAIVCQP